MTAKERRAMKLEITKLTAENAALRARGVKQPTTGYATPERKPRGKRKAKLDPVKAAKAAKFVGWLRETAEARQARQARNTLLADGFRAAGFRYTPAQWDSAKALWAQGYGVVEICAMLVQADKDSVVLS